MSPLFYLMVRLAHFCLQYFTISASIIILVTPLFHSALTSWFFSYTLFMVTGYHSHRLGFPTNNLIQKVLITSNFNML